MISLSLSFSFFWMKELCICMYCTSTSQLFDKKKHAKEMKKTKLVAKPVIPKDLFLKKYMYIYNSISATPLALGGRYAGCCCSIALCLDLVM